MLAIHFVSLSASPSLKARLSQLEPSSFKPLCGRIMQSGWLTFPAIPAPLDCLSGLPLCPPCPSKRRSGAQVSSTGRAQVRRVSCLRLKPSAFYRHTCCLKLLTRAVMPLELPRFLMLSEAPKPWSAQVSEACKLPLV